MLLKRTIKSMIMLSALILVISLGWLIMHPVIARVLAVDQNGNPCGNTDLFV